MAKIPRITDIEEALESIRPYLIADGGDVKVIGVDSDLVVTIELLGNCGNCPISSMTMRAGIEEAVKKSIPTITAVKAINIEVQDNTNTVSSSV